MFQLNRSGLRTAALILSLTTLPAFAAKKAGPDPDVAPPPTNLAEMLDAWEADAGADALTLAEHVSESYPDLLGAWSDQAAGALGGSLVAVYEDRQPDWLTDFRANFLEVDADGVAQGDDQSFLDFLVHHRPTWFAELEIDVEDGGGKDLHHYLDGVQPEVIMELEEHNQAFNANPVGFLGWVNDHIVDTGLAGLAHGYVGAILDEGAPLGTASTCRCEIEVSGQEEPAFQEDQHWPNLEEKRNNGTWKQWLHGYSTLRGAAQRLASSRFIRNGLNSLTMTDKTSSASISFRMRCQRPVNGDLVLCEAGDGCSAQIKVKAKYDSSFEVMNDATGVPFQSKGSSSMALNAGVLKQNAGSANESVLFEKGLALERNYNTSVSAQSVMNGIKDGYAIYQSIDSVASGDDDFNDLLGNINNDQIQSVLGVVSHNGTRGTSYANLQASYSNVGAAPVVLQPQDDVSFDLFSVSTARSRGWGKTSQSATRTANSYYLVGVADSFVCNNASAPKPAAAWAYNSVWQAPYSTASMRASVEGFILGQIGHSVTAGPTGGEWTAP